MAPAKLVFRWYVVARQDALARWEFRAVDGHWVDEVVRARRFAELADAIVAAAGGGEAMPWEWAMMFAAVEHVPEFSA